VDVKYFTLVEIFQGKFSYLPMFKNPNEPIINEAPIESKSHKEEEMPEIDREVKEPTIPFFQYKYEPSSLAATEFQRSKSLDTVM